MCPLTDEEIVHAAATLLHDVMEVQENFQENWRDTLIWFQSSRIWWWMRADKSRSWQEVKRTRTVRHLHAFQGRLNLGSGGRKQQHACTSQKLSGVGDATYGSSLIEKG